MERLASGTVLGDRYELHDVVGSGGMAAVWHATDSVLDRPVAVKVLHAQLAEDPAFLERFRAEAMASARLTHPNIVNVFDTGTDGPVAFIVMEMFDGETLRERLSRDGPMDPGEAASVMVQVLSALELAHENGVIHRDVKPANVLVSPDGRVKVTDFGIAKAAYEGADPTTTGQVLGSVPYLSPEQVEGEPVDARSDVYGAGIMLYELLTGRTPFQAETEIAAAMMRLTNDPVPPRAIRAGISRPLEAVVLRALARDREARFATASDMAGALSRLQGPGATASLPRVVVEQEPAHGGGFFRSWMVVPLLAILVAAVVIVIALLAGKLQLGGPLGIEPKESSRPRSSKPPQSARPLDIKGVQSFDPFGTGGEHDEDLKYATDGDPGTYWLTEGYNSPDLDKPGVGIAFDLGSPQEVDGFSLQTRLEGWRFEISVGDDLEAMRAQPEESFIVDAATMGKALPPATGRYVLVWITRVVRAPDGQNRAEISEFSVLGPGG